MNETISNFKKYYRFIKNQKKYLILIIILCILEAILSVAIPIIDAQIIVSITDNMIQQMIFMAVCITLIKVIGVVFSKIRIIIYWKIYISSSLDIQSELGKEILKLDNKTLDDNSSGVFIQRLMGDTNKLSVFFERLSRTIEKILVNIGVFISVFIINKIIFIFVVIYIIVLYSINSKRIKINKENNKEYAKLNDNVTGFTSELVRGARDIKMLNAEDSFISSFYVRFLNLSKFRYNINKTNNYLNLLISIIDNCMVLIFIVLLAYLLSASQLTAAFAIVIINFSNKWTSFIIAITDLKEYVAEFNISSTRIFEVLNGSSFSKESFGTKHIRKVKGNFEFKNVSFKYDENEVLDKLSFKVNANETVAFVGKSGAGKTTIFSLLCKMYDNYEGLITIDGNDIKELDKDSIRGNITIVSQNPYIFNLSIKDNLKLVKRNLTNKEMVEACKMACLDEFIESLPDKYDTIVGEGGVTLSGGQKQRLAIARAFVQKTEIILFDEATSALDNETQHEIQKAIDNLQKDYTILIIAHRLSTIKNANRILFIEDGKVKREGTHEELLKKCKSYKELYEAEIEK